MTTIADRTTESRAKAAPCLRWRYRIARRQIGYLRFLLEGYEGLAQLVATRGRAEVTLIVPASREAEAEALLLALRDELGLQRITEALLDNAV